MVENHPEQSGNYDDLDLLTLLEKKLLFFRNYGRMITIFTVAGILAGLVIYKISPKQYSSTMLVHSAILANPEVANIIEDWNTLLKQYEYKALAERLHCHPAMLKSVRSVTTAEIQKLYIPNNPNGFAIKVLVKDNSVLDSLCNGIIYGFENNPYIKERLDSKKAMLTALIAKVQLETQRLDSTKETINSSIRNNKAYVPSFIVDISAINSQAIALQEKLLGYREELALTRAINVFHRFEKFEQPVSPKFVKSIVLGFIGGFATGYLLAVYLFLRKRILQHNQSGFSVHTT